MRSLLRLRLLQVGSLRGVAGGWLLEMPTDAARWLLLT